MIVLRFLGPEAIAKAENVWHQLYLLLNPHQLGHDDGTTEDWFSAEKSIRWKSPSMFRTSFLDFITWKCGPSSSREFYGDSISNFEVGELSSRSWCRWCYCWWFRNPKQPPGMMLKPVVNKGRNYQHQLVSRISSINSQIVRHLMAVHSNDSLKSNGYDIFVWYAVDEKQ